MEKENVFHHGDVVWAKIRGYAWWPATIARIELQKPETKFYVKFIGDNSHALLPDSKIKPFLKEFDKLSNTKMKKLQASIQMAKQLIECRNKAARNDFEKIEKDETNDKPPVKIAPVKRRKKVVLAKNQNNLNPKALNTTESESIEDKEEIVKKLFNYLFYICKNIDSLNLSVEKDLLIKLLNYLKELKLEKPIQFLKKSSIGTFVKYIQTKIENPEINKVAEEAYKNLEKQVLEQLFSKKKL